MQNETLTQEEIIYHAPNFEQTGSVCGIPDVPLTEWPGNHKLIPSNAHAEEITCPRCLELKTYVRTSRR